MSIPQIRKVLSESLFGEEQPKIGFMEYDYSGTDVSEFENLFKTLKDQLNQVSVNTKYMRDKKEQRRIIIVTTQDKAEAVDDIFSYFKIPCVKSIFDPQGPDEKAQNNYPELSDVQNAGRRTY